MTANLVCEDVPGRKRVGRFLGKDSFAVEYKEGQSFGVLGFIQGLAQQLSQFHGSHDWCETTVSKAGARRKTKR